jgi:hypothetical protein
VIGIYTSRWHKMKMLFMMHTLLLLYFLWRYSPNLGLGLPPWNSPFHFGFLDLTQSVWTLGRVISSSQSLYLYTNTEKHTHTHTLNIHALSGIRNHDPGFRASEDSACLRPLGYRDRPHTSSSNSKFKQVLSSVPTMTTILRRNVGLNRIALSERQQVTWREQQLQFPKIN